MPGTGTTVLFFCQLQRLERGCLEGAPLPGIRQNRGEDRGRPSQQFTFDSRLRKTVRHVRDRVDRPGFELPRQTGQTAGNPGERFNAAGRIVDQVLKQASVVCAAAVIPRAIRCLPKPVDPMKRIIAGKLPTDGGDNARVILAGLPLSGRRLGLRNCPSRFEARLRAILDASRVCAAEGFCGCSAAVALGRAIAGCVRAIRRSLTLRAPSPAPIGLYLIHPEEPGASV
jgi:hypothetical protein